MIRDTIAASKSLTGKNLVGRKDFSMKVTSMFTTAARDIILKCSTSEKALVLSQEEPQEHENCGNRKALSKPLSWVSVKEKGATPYMFVCKSMSPFKGRIKSRITLRFIIKRRSFPVKPVVINIEADMHYRGILASIMGQAQSILTVYVTTEKMTFDTFKTTDRRLMEGL